MAKIFSKFGLKRDLNLADLSSSTNALNFLLDDIKGTKDSFTKDDLELIENLAINNVPPTAFTSAADATVKVSIANAPPKVYDPLITLQNRFDRAYFSTSEPFYAGGDGLTARYFDSYQIGRVGTGASFKFFNPTTNFLGFIQDKDPITGRGTGGEIDRDQFWERGGFSYGSKINNKLLSEYGGVEWTGFYKPNETGSHSIRITTTGFFKLEFDNRQAVDKEFTFEPETDTFRLNDLNFMSTGITTLFDQTKLVSRGEIVSSSITSSTTDINFAGANYGVMSPTSTNGNGVNASYQFQRNPQGELFIVGQKPVSIGRLYQAGNTLTFAAANFTDGSQITNVVVTISETGGYEIFDTISNVTTGIKIGARRSYVINLGDLNQWFPYKMRLSFFIDDDTIEIMEEGSNLEKLMVFDILTPSTSGTSFETRFDYKSLFNEFYFDRYQIGDFKKFIDKSISLYGTNIGNRLTLGLENPKGTALEKGDNYQSLININPITTFYVAPLGKTIADLKQSRTGTFSAGVTTIALSPFGSNRTENIEVGNYVKGNGIYLGSRVTSITTNLGVKIFPAPFSSQLNTNLEFISHKGLVAYGNNGKYNTNSFGERGISLGVRGISSIRIVEGQFNNQSEANVDYTSAGTNPISVEGADITSNTTNGFLASFNVTRNTFGSLSITINTPGTGYSNYEKFIIPGELINNSFLDENNIEQFVDVVFEVVTLTDCFFVGKPELSLSYEQIFKSASIPSNGNFSYTDKIVDEINGIIKTSSDSSIINRFIFSAENQYALGDNSIAFKNQSASWPANGTTDTEWYIYQSFGLNNDGLSNFCEGVTTKRILQKLTPSVTGGTYSPYATPVTATTITGTGTNMTVKYRRNGANNIEAAWVVNPGDGYTSGDIISIPGSTPQAQFVVGYTDLTGDVTLRLEDSKGIAVGNYAHLFPSIRFQTATVTGAGGASIELLSTDVRIATGGIVIDPDDPAGAVEVTLSAGGANVLQSNINFVRTVITKITFSATSENKEVCFRPTDTSPPFGATARGLSTNRDVKAVIDFTGSTRVGGSPGVFNNLSKLSYGKLELKTFEELDLSGAPTPQSTVKFAVSATDVFNGKVAIDTPSGTFYLLLGS